MAAVIPNRPTRLLLHCMILCVFGVCSAVLGQEAQPTTGEAVLSDEFGRLGDCEFGGRLDTFLSELSNNPDHHGYIINYRSVDELPGDRDNLVRDRMITNHISFRNFDRSRITLMTGGYRQEMSTELWLVPPGAKAPAPSRTLAEPKTPQRTTFLYANRYLYSEYDEDALQEFVLQSVKEKEEADRLGNEAEWKAETESNAAAESKTESESEADAEAEPELETETSDAAEDSAPFVDERTPEEKEEQRFSWANVGIARLLAERNTGTGVIIFYADDQRYDIGKMAAFIDRGRNLLSEHGPINESRLRIEFGGYRDEPQVEFWFVPAKGKAARATPADRPVEEPESNQD